MEDVLVSALGRRGNTQLRIERPTRAASGAPLTWYLLLAAVQYLTNQLKGQEVCFGLWVKGYIHLDREGMAALCSPSAD